MSLVLSRIKFILSAIGALLVVLGMVLKNSTEQIGDKNHPIGRIFGSAAFVGGWILVAYSVAIDNKGLLVLDLKTLLTVISVVTIIMTAQQIKETMEQSQTVPVEYSILFSAAWLLLGYTVGMLKGGFYSKMGLFGSLIILISLFMSLPLQRKHCIVDGPGMPMLTVGWSALIFANALVAV